MNMRREKWDIQKYLNPLGEKDREFFKKLKWKNKTHPGNKPPHKAWYATYRWKKLRKKVLARDPLCVHCLKAEPKRFNTATVADHIKAREHFTEGEFFNLEGLQGLCRECHNEKTLGHDLPERTKEKLTAIKFF